MKTRFAVALLLALASCSAQPPCSAANCPSGCCSPAGVCMSGSAPEACGVGGAACQTCGFGQSCQAGFCSQPSGGGTAQNNTGGGSTQLGCSETTPCPQGAMCNKTSFFCECPSGQYLTASGCLDVNECLNNNGGCDAHAACANTPASSPRRGLGLSGTRPNNPGSGTRGPGLLKDRLRRPSARLVPRCLTADNRKQARLSTS